MTSIQVEASRVREAFEDPVSVQGERPDSKVDREAHRASDAVLVSRDALAEISASQQVTSSRGANKVLAGEDCATAPCVIPAQSASALASRVSPSPSSVSTCLLFQAGIWLAGRTGAPAQSRDRRSGRARHGSHMRRRVTGSVSDGRVRDGRGRRRDGPRWPSVTFAREAAEHPVSRGAALPILYGALAGLQAYDGWSTVSGVRRGAVESNRAIAGAATSSSAMWALKVGATSASVYAAERMWRAASARGGRGDDGRGEQHDGRGGRAQRVDHAPAEVASLPAAPRARHMRLRYTGAPWPTRWNT